MLLSTPAALLAVVDCIDWSGYGVFMIDEVDQLLEDKDGKKMPASGAASNGEEEGKIRGGGVLLRWVWLQNG